MPRWKYKKRRRYPHLLTADKAIWERFIDKYPDFFEYVDYDVHVGEGIEIDPGWEPEIQRLATILTQKRIDVVGFKGNETWIIEIKPYPGVSAIGQIVCYHDLYVREHRPPGPVATAIICERMDRDIENICETHNIHVFKV